MEKSLLKEMDSTTVSKRIRKDVQSAVDTYLDAYKEYKELEKILKSSREIIEPYMEASGLVKIQGSRGGSIARMTAERTEVTSRYTSYQITDIEPLLGASAKKQCIVKVVDRDILELLVKTNAVDKDILLLKKTTPTTSFSVKP